MKCCINLFFGGGRYAQRAECPRLCRTVASKFSGTRMGDALVVHRFGHIHDLHGDGEGLPLSEAPHCVGFILVHIEHGIELGDLQKVFYTFGKVQQLHGAAGVRHRGVAGN